MDNQPEKQAITPESLSLEEKLKELISYQIDVNETEKNIYKLTSKENLDIKLQIEKGKNLMDMRRMACAYIEEGRIHIGSCIVYANPLGLFARPMIKKLNGRGFTIEGIQDINEIVYPNGDSEDLIVLDSKNVKALRVKNDVDDTLKKLVTDFQDSLDMLEKRFLAKRMTDLYSDKWSIGIVFVLGACLGYILSKSLKI